MWRWLPNSIAICFIHHLGFDPELTWGQIHSDQSLVLSRVCASGYCTHVLTYSHAHAPPPSSLKSSVWNTWMLLSVQALDVSRVTHLTPSSSAFYCCIPVPNSNSLFVLCWCVCGCMCFCFTVQSFTFTRAGTGHLSHPFLSSDGFDGTVGSKPSSL